MDIDERALLLEYWKNQWAQRRHFETAEVNSTAFLTGTAGVVLGFTFKEGQISVVTLAAGIIVFLIGAANWRINRAYFIESRYRNSLARETRRTLERLVPNWSVETPSEIRRTVSEELKLPSPSTGLGKKIHEALQAKPIATMLLGVLVILLSITSAKLKFFGAFGT
jgi:hypothetical protein